METKSNKLGVMPIPKLLVTMALPLIISMLVQALYGIVDSIFVSKISENALAAVSLAYPAQNILIAFSVGTGVGVSSFLSRTLGEKNQEKANQAADHAIFLWIAMSLIFAIIGFTCGELFFSFQTNNKEIIEYGTKYFNICVGLSFGIFGQITFEQLLQSTGRTVDTMIMQSTGAIINIIFDPIFIFVFDMGVAGAAYATVLGQVCAAFLGMYLNYHKNVDIHINMRKFKLDFDILKQIYKVAFPVIVMMSLGSIMIFGMNLILISFTSTATAVFGIYYKLQGFFFMPLYGTKNALIPIVAYNYGAKRRDRIEEVLKLSLKLVLALMLTGVAVFSLMPTALLKMFDASDSMMEMGVTALRIISISFPFAGLAVTFTAFFEATGKGTYSLINSLVRQILVLLPCAYILASFGNVNFVWFSLPIAEICGFVISSILLKRLFSKIDL